MNQQEFRELSAGHALRALTSDEEIAFAAALSQHPQWQRIVDEDLSAAAGLGRSIPEVPPPSALRGQILDGIVGLPQQDPVADTTPHTDGVEATSSQSSVGAGDSTEPSRDEVAAAGVARQRQASRAWRIGAFALAASVVLLTTVVFGPRILESFAPQDPAVVALQQVENASDAASESLNLAGGVSATLHWSDSAGQAVLVADGMQPAEAGTDFELWLVRGDEAISVGLMQPEAGEQSVFVADTFVPGDTIAITVEQAGGSPSGAPTSDPILAIATA